MNALLQESWRQSAEQLRREGIPVKSMWKFVNPTDNIIQSTRALVEVRSNYLSFDGSLHLGFYPDFDEGAESNERLAASLPNLSSGEFIRFVGEGRLVCIYSPSGS